MGHIGTLNNDPWFYHLSFGSLELIIQEKNRFVNMNYKKYKIGDFVKLKPPEKMKEYNHHHKIILGIPLDNYKKLAKGVEIRNEYDINSFVELGGYILLYKFIKTGFLELPDKLFELE